MKKSKFISKKMHSRCGELVGTIIGVTQRSCGIEGCRGVVLSVRWPEGHLTYPCSAGCKQLPNGDWKIE